MKDLVINYNNENGEKITKEYDTMFDFVADMESDKTDIPMLDYRNVHAEFYGSPFITKDFDTINDLYQFCSDIVKDLVKDFDKTVDEIELLK